MADDWGGTFWREDGRVQFDSDWPALCRRQKGRATGNTTITVNGGRRPHIAIRPINCNAAIYSANRSGNNFTYQLTFFQTGAGGYCDWWVYDAPPEAPGSEDWHIEFYDTLNRVTFTTAYPPMRPVPEGAQPSGKIYAIVPAIGPKWAEQVLTIEDTFGNVIGTDWSTTLGGWIFDGSEFYTQDLATTFHFGVSSDQGYDPALTSRVLIDVTDH